MNKPFISVIIPLYNKVEYVSETLYSLINQSFTDFECLIVDDNSNDGSYEKCLTIISSHQNFKLIRKEDKKKGVSASRNLGISLAKGEYIMFLDADDLLSDNSLQIRQQEALEFKNYDGLVFNTEKINFDNVKSYIFNIDPNDENKFNYISLFLNQQYAWTVMSGLWKKKIFNKINFIEDLDILEDVVFHLEILLNDFQIKRIKITDNYYREIDRTNKLNDIKRPFNLFLAFSYLNKNYKDEILRNNSSHASFKNFNKRVYLGMLSYKGERYKKKKSLLYLKLHTEISTLDMYMIKLLYLTEKFNCKIKGIGLYKLSKLIKSFIFTKNSELAW